MSKHIADKDHTSSASKRPVAFSKIEHADAPPTRHKEIGRKTHERNGLSRLKQFLRIDRQG